MCAQLWRFQRGAQRGDLRFGHSYGRQRCSRYSPRRFGRNGGISSFGNQSHSAARSSALRCAKLRLCHGESGYRFAPLLRLPFLPPEWKAVRQVRMRVLSQ
jgi:hypothetical protein